MKSTDEFLSRILPHVLGCPIPLAQQALVDAAILFCEDTLATQAILDPFTSIPGQADYELDAPVAQQVSRVLSVQLGNTLLAPWAEDDAQAAPATEGNPTCYTTERLDGMLVLKLIPTPVEAQTLRVRVATRPVRGTTTLDDDLLTLWVEPLVAVTLSRLMGIPGQPFSNPGTALYWAAQAAQMSRTFRVERSVGQVRASRRIRPLPLM